VLSQLYFVFVFVFVFLTGADCELKNHGKNVRCESLLAPYVGARLRESCNRCSDNDIDDSGVAELAEGRRSR
jgi:hypothetical protein